MPKSMQIIRNIKSKAGIVFAGYGIMAPEFGWNDYEGVDVRNKLVLVLSGEPSKPGTDRTEDARPHLPLRPTRSPRRPRRAYAPWC
jgi:hypothetical protein